MDMLFLFISKGPKVNCNGHKQSQQSGVLETAALREINRCRNVNNWTDNINRDNYNHRYANKNSGRDKNKTTQGQTILGSEAKLVK